MDTFDREEYQVIDKELMSSGSTRHMIILRYLLGWMAGCEHGEDKEFLKGMGHALKVSA
jgi:hypothetical protein